MTTGGQREREREIEVQEEHFVENQVMTRDVLYTYL